MKLASLVCVTGLALKSSFALESAGDFHDDSFSWQWNYKEEIARIVDEIISHGYISKSDGTELISSTKLDKYINDLGDYMDFKLKFPIQEYFDYCAGQQDAHMISYQDYVQCRLKLQRGMQLYPNIYPLISQEQMKQLRIFKIRSGYSETLSKDDFKKLETLALIISGAAIFQNSDTNSDGNVDVFEGYTNAEGYQMLTELTRMYKREIAGVTRTLASCTGSGDVIKIILTVAKLEWHEIKKIVATGGVQSNIEYNQPEPTRAPTRAPVRTRARTRAPTRAPTTTATTTTTTPRRRTQAPRRRTQAPRRNYNQQRNRYNQPSESSQNRNRQNYQNRQQQNYNSNKRQQYQQQRQQQKQNFQKNRQPSKAVDNNSKIEKCGDFRDNRISAEEKKNRLLCFFNSKRRSTNH